MPSRGVARLLGFKVVSLGPPFLLLVALFAQPFQPARPDYGLLGAIQDLILGCNHVI